MRVRAEHLEPIPVAEALCNKLYPRASWEVRTVDVEGHLEGTWEVLVLCR
jgi:hypothetical protein